MTEPPRKPYALAPATQQELGDVLPIGGQVSVALFGLAVRVRRTVGARTALAVGLFAIASLVRWLLDEALPPGFPYLTYFPAVIVSSFLGGLYGGVLCATLCGLGAWYWFIPPFNSFALNAASATALGFYALIAVVIVTLFHLIDKAVAQLLDQQRQMRELLQRQRTLFQELQHRVANNLAFVSALFGMQKRRLKDNPAAVSAFDDARIRLDTMGRVHRRLYDPLNADLPLTTFLRDLATDIVAGADSRAIHVRVEAADIRLPLEQVMTLALIVTEVVTNALKHAFVGRPEGRIDITLERLDATRVRLIVRDDGPGSSLSDPATSNGLGMRILRSFVTSLKGELVVASDRGLVTRIDFPTPEGNAP